MVLTLPWSEKHRMAESDPEDDSRLAARAARDREAFAALYERYLDPVYRYCYRRLGSRERAREM